MHDATPRASLEGMRTLHGVRGAVGATDACQSVLAFAQFMTTPLLLDKPMHRGPVARSLQASAGMLVILCMTCTGDFG